MSQKKTAALRYLGMGYRSELRRRLARSVKRLRAKTMLTQEQLAYRAKLGVRHIQMIEAAAVSPTLDTLGLVANGFDVDISELFKP